MSRRKGKGPAPGDGRRRLADMSDRDRRTYLTMLMTHLMDIAPAGAQFVVIMGPERVEEGDACNWIGSGSMDDAVNLSYYGARAIARDGMRGDLN